MKRLLFLTLSTLCAASFAQLPDYVPTDGLVAWYALDGDAFDKSGQGYDGQIISAESQTNRFGMEEGALKFSSASDEAVNLPDMPVFPNFSFSFWVRLNTTPNGSDSWIYGDWLNGGFGIVIDADTNNQLYVHVDDGLPPLNDNGSCTSNYFFELGEWVHVVILRENGSVFFWVDGELYSTLTDNSENPSNSNDSGITRIGASFNGTQPFSGDIDDFGYWSRALTDDEILELFQPILGCTDDSACNYDLEAVMDNGSCLYIDDCGECGGASIAGCLDDQSCNFDAEAVCDDGSCDYSCCPGPGCCGEGMHWDWNLGECAITNPSDSNFDGCVQLSDLLDLLSEYGDCTILDETETVLSDSVLHNGQWYGLVTIGNQVWFAENLNTTIFNDGDAIDGVCGQDEWFNGQMPSQNVYGDCGLTVYDGVNDVDENEAVYGRLYNVWAVLDERGICPAGYRVSTNEDWSYIVEILGGEGVAASKMKTPGIWEENTGLWETHCSNLECFPNDATNESGLSIQPGGNRGYNGWLYANQRRRGVFITSTLAGPAQPMIRRLDSSPLIIQDIGSQYQSASVRCVKDAE